MLDIVKTAELAEEFGVTTVRIGQMVAEYEDQYGETLGEIIGTARVFSRSEAQKLRRFRNELRSYTKSQNSVSRT